MTDESLALPCQQMPAAARLLDGEPLSMTTKAPTIGSEAHEQLEVILGAGSDRERRCRHERMMPDGPAQERCFVATEVEKAPPTNVS
jgi:hypothetical protein